MVAWTCHVVSLETSLFFLSFATLLCSHQNMWHLSLVSLSTLSADKLKQVGIANNATKLTASARLGLLNMADYHFLWRQLEHRRACCIFTALCLQPIAAALTSISVHQHCPSDWVKMDMTEFWKLSITVTDKKDHVSIHCTLEIVKILLSQSQFWLLTVTDCVCACVCVRVCVQIASTTLMPQVCYRLICCCFSWCYEFVLWWKNSNLWVWLCQSWSWIKASGTARSVWNFNARKMHTSVTCQWPWLYCKVTAMFDSFKWNFMFLFD